MFSTFESSSVIFLTFHAFFTCIYFTAKILFLQTFTHIITYLLTMLWPMEIAHNSFYPFVNPLLISEWTMSELKITSKIRNYFSKNISINFQYFSIQRKHQSVTYSFFFYSRKKTICKINMQQLKETYCLPEAIEWRASNLIVTDGFLISLAQSTLFPLFALQYSYLLVSGCVFLEFDQEVNKRSESPISEKSLTF